MTILVLGATGNTGKALVRKLNADNADFAVMARDSEGTGELDVKPSQVRVGTFDDVATLTEAMQGISRIYLVMPMHPNTEAWTNNVIAAAKAASMPYIVKQSGLNASATATSEVIRDHAATDALIQSSGLTYTIIQPNSFFQNLYGNLPTINATGQFYMPLGDKALSVVDINDVADLAAAVLTQDGHEGKTYKITGPQALSMAEQAQILSQASGKDIQYVNVPKEAVQSALLDAGMDDWSAKNISELLAWFAEGPYSEVTATVETVLGRKPRPFADFAEEFAHAVTT